MTTTRNPFDALGEDYDPSAAQSTSVTQSTQQAKDEPKEVIAKQTTSKKRDPTRQSAGEARRGGDYVPRGGAGAGRGGRSRGPENANEQYANDKTVGHDANASKPVDEAAARGTARGRGRGRGNGNRREFDRRNASGKTDTPKATEQAWGNEAEAQQTATAEPTDPQDPAAPEAVAEVVPAPVEEEEDNTISYEEYLKQKAQKSLNISAPAIRQANEGADDSKWTNDAFTREAESAAYFAGKQKAKTAATKERKVKETLDIEQRFYQAPVASRGRGEARGRGRGGRGRGEGRGRGAPRGSSRGGSSGSGSKPSSAGLTLSDETAFPSLS